MQVTFEAKISEVIIDDDEGLISLFTKWSDIGGYLSISRDDDDQRLYCEYCDQSNGFYSETIDILIYGNIVKFKLGNTESFSKTELIQEVNIIFKKNIDEVISCIDELKSV
ncbi:MAG: hypothetical protein FWF41_01950 [Betaproteobacteria bacterium]|nr:hypothetical protein [Betaproteobacteria bacterium]